jgi:hypothetical protein
MRGPRAWLNNVLQKPVLVLHERVDSAKGEITRELEQLRDDVEVRAHRLEVRVATWGVAAVMLAVSGIFLLIGVWLALSGLAGPVWASVLLAALFAMLAAMTLLLPPKLMEDRQHPKLKPGTRA